MDGQVQYFYRVDTGYAGVTNYSVRVTACPTPAYTVGFAIEAY